MCLVSSYIVSILESFKNFFVDFCQTDDEGRKHFKYAEKLTKLAQREEVKTFVFRSLTNCGFSF